MRYLVGKVLSSRYEIVEKIGGGGMAVVYRAKDKVLNRFIAIKILRKEYTNDQEFIEKFRQESLSAASLTHPNIVSIYDTGVDDNTYYIVMEYVKGLTLKEYIKKKGKLDEKEAINISIKIAEALKNAHKNNVIHRDIKPQNILLTNEGIVKVADFGIARATNTSTINNTSNIIGSVHYFSPEQARGGYVDEKSDIYSLGVVMYEMVTGEVPFDADNHVVVAMKHVNERAISPSMKNSKMTKKFEKIILKSMEKQQSYRYSNTTELLKDLYKIDHEKEQLVDIMEDKLTDSPTIVMPKIEDNMKVEADSEKEKALKRFFSNNEDTNENEKENITERKSKVKITIFAALFALAITAIISFFALRYITNYLTVEEVVVPNLIGQSEEIAKEKIEKLGLKFEVKDRINSSDYKEGCVIKQNIDAGKPLKKDFPIDVIISLGEEYVKVPDLFKKYSNETDIVLSEVGLIEGDISYEYNDKIPGGLVVKQTPEAGEDVVIGSAVSYVISKGAEVEYFLMPNLIGSNVEFAKTKILDKGFNIGTVTYEYNDEYEKDIVTYQNYPFGLEIEENTEINLLISNGSDPNVVTTEAAIETEEDNNDELVIKQIVIKLPEERDSVMVTIERITDDLRQDVYQQRHETTEKNIIINLQGRGEQLFEVFFDSESQGTRKINFD